MCRFCFRGTLGCRCASIPDALHNRALRVPQERRLPVAVSDPGSEAGLSIGAISRRSGVSEGTLRMWEARYAFPTPARLPSGHRRYSERDLERVRAVVRAREQGLPLSMAIHRAQNLDAEPRPSVYRALMAGFEHLHPQLLPKAALEHMSHAIEDECSVRAAHPLLFACFQRARHYRKAQARWRELALGAERAIVLADFQRTRLPKGGPAEVRIDHDDPLMREWVVVCEAPELSACLVGWERPHDSRGPRSFETIWTVEPPVVREAARVCCELAGRRAPELVADLKDRLADPPAPAITTHLRAAVALATRMALYATMPSSPSRS